MDFLQTEVGLGQEVLEENSAQSVLIKFSLLRPFLSQPGSLRHEGVQQADVQQAGCQQPQVVRGGTVQQLDGGMTWVGLPAYFPGSLFSAGLDKDEGRLRL